MKSTKGRFTERSGVNIIAGGRVIGRRQGSTKSFYLTDHLGSTRAVFTSAGVVQEVYDYYPFGLVMPGRTLVSGTGTKEQFTGKERDEETGLHYFGARYYMPAVGRWGSVDPLSGEFPGWSPYNYVFDNPIRLVDPDGMAPDDYYIDTRERSIRVVQTGDSFDRFYDSSGERPTLIAQLERNDAGLVRFPDAGTGFNQYGTVDRGGRDPKTGEDVGRGDHYLTPEAAASLFAVALSLEMHGITISFGDMSSSNGSDPWQPGFPHHAGHGHMGNRSGMDVDFRYIGKNGASFRSRTATVDSPFSVVKNNTVFDIAVQYGFHVNYHGTRGPSLRGALRASGHNDHGHLGYGIQPIIIKSQR